MALSFTSKTLHAEDDLDQGDLGLEAVVAPQFLIGSGDKLGSRNYFGLDFFRISSGTSLQALYGTGGDYWDAKAILRLSRLSKLFGESFSSGLIWGLGVGASYSPGLPIAETGTVDRKAFSDIIANPFVRYLFDINGWQGIFAEVGYEAHYRVYIKGKDASSRKADNLFMMGIGIAFETERNRDN